MFLFVILCQYDEGWALIAKSLEKRTKQKSVMKDVLQTFECLLCFDAWLRQPQHWNLDHIQVAVMAAQCSIKQLMRMIKKAYLVLQVMDGNWQKCMSCYTSWIT